MPKVSKESAPITEGDGPVAVKTAELDGYTVNFLTIADRFDMAPMLASLPGGQCQCPHWGYVLKGRMTIDYGDHEEVIDAGDAFYLPPGHVPTTEPGTEYVQISPTDQLAATTAAIMQAIQARQGA